MLYVFHLLDAPGTAGLRQRLRPEHKAYLAQVAHRIAFAGPLTQEDGLTMLGSLLVVDFSSRDAALGWLADEPFTRAGLYASCQVHAFDNLWPQRCGFAPPPQGDPAWTGTLPPAVQPGRQGRPGGPA